MNPKTFLLAACVAPLMACSAGAPKVPDVLGPGANAQFALTVSARGMQIYECRAGQWAFVAPEADLFDAAGRAFGTHGAGPYWQAKDGSRVVASVKARMDAPEAGAIPWLLLAAKPADGPATAGVLTGVTHIQRVNTAGGSAPTGSCRPGHPLRVPYRADYHFYKS